MKIKKLKCYKCIYNDGCTSKKYYYSILDNINNELDISTTFICELKCKKYVSRTGIKNILYKLGSIFDCILEVFF